MGVSKNTGTPKWRVKIMENPMNTWMIWGVFPLFLVQHPYNYTLERKQQKQQQKNTYEDPFFVFGHFLFPRNGASKKRSKDRSKPGFGGSSLAPFIARRRRSERRPTRSSSPSWDPGFRMAWRIVWIPTKTDGKTYVLRPNK